MYFYIVFMCYNLNGDIMLSNGIDLVKIDRFEDLKKDDKFMYKIFTEKEIKYIKFRDWNTATIAGIFAAKEACLKALKKGIDACPLKDIEISHDNDVPFIIFHNNINKSFSNVSLSISHDGDYAIAIVSIII